MIRWCIPLLLFPLALSAGCTERKRRAPVEAKELIQQQVGTTPTSPQHALSYRFGDRVELIGYDVDTRRVIAGEPFTVTWHWKVDAPLGESWRQFTHVLDSRGVSRLNMDENRLLFGAYPSGAWKAGQYVRDPQTITLPADWKDPGVQLMLGFWRDGERLAVTKGAHRENRVLGLALPVARAGSEAIPPPPELRVPARAGEITLDGKLDEPDWATAPRTRPFVNTMRGSEGSFPVTARMLYDDSALFVAFEVEDDYLKADHRTHDDHLWEQDTVEIMVDPDGDGRNYFEMQVSPRGVTFDTRYDSRRKPRPFGHVDWNAELEAGVAVRGTLEGEKGDQADEGYTVEMRIPWTAFAHGTPAAKPPAAGDTWRANLFVMDSREKGQRATGWSPPLVGDFHILDRFGTLTFAPPSVPSSAKPAQEDLEEDVQEGVLEGSKTGAAEAKPAP